MNEVKLSGKVVSLTKDYDKGMEWYNQRFMLKGDGTNHPVECFDICTKEPWEVAEGDEVLVCGTLRVYQYEDYKDLAIQVDKVFQLKEVY